VPELSGGGAEKVARVVVGILLKNGRLGNLVAHRLPDGFPKEKAFPLPSLRWIPCLRAVVRWSKRNPGRIRFLNLNYVLFAPWLRLLDPGSRILARPGNTISAEIGFLSAWKRPFFWSAYQTAFLSADTIVAQSRTMAGDLKQTFAGIRHKIRILPNPVAPAGRSPSNRRTHREMPEEPFIFCAMTFKPQKDFPTLFRAYRLFSESLDSSPPLLVIAGRLQGPELQSLARREAARFAGRIRLVGEVANPDAWIRRAKFCALSSHYEGNSNFLLEAVYHGKKIAATNCPGANAEMARQHRGILLCRPGNAESMARKMTQANRSAAGSRRRISRDGLDEFEKKLLALIG